MKTTERIVVSVGGSLLVPNKIDTDFLSHFRTHILRATKRGLSFFIIAGGGKTARNYQDAARSVRGNNVSHTDLDWLGIHATHLNAHLLRTVFYEDAAPRISTDPSEVRADHEPIIIAAGWRPGASTDYDAVLIAKNLGATKLVNLSNIDYVYDSNPRENPDAKKIEKISWKAFRELIPKECSPGLSYPFDPIAAKEAESLGLEVAVINGKKLDAFEDYLSGEQFIGTVIS